MLTLLCFSAALNVMGVNGLPNRDSNACGKPIIKPNAELATDVTDRIVGGVETIPYSWPWQVRFLQCDSDGENCDGICGGSLLNPSTVLTAAHCVDFGDMPANTIKIRFGAFDLSETTEEEQIIQVASYQSGTSMDEDVAVLTLESPVSYNDHISPICLPTTDIPAGTTCYVTGFGQHRRRNTGQSDVLRQTQLTTLDSESCWENTPDFKSDREICAYWKHGTSSCYGDSGGPFVCLVNGIWEQHGIVSRGSKVCGDEPSVYAKVFHHLDFIKSQL